MSRCYNPCSCAYICVFQFSLMTLVVYLDLLALWLQDLGQHVLVLHLFQPRTHDATTEKEEQPISTRIRNRPDLFTQD